MARTQIAVSLEDGLAKIAYGAFHDSSLVITRTLTLKDEELDDFLVREKTTNFIVVSNFKTFYQDVLLLPPAEEKYLKTLVESEIRKNAPELKDFTFFHTILKERLHEGKMVKETFVFAVDSSNLNNLIDRFTRYGKNISRLYSDIFALSQLVQLSEIPEDKTLLYVLDSSSSKSLFLIKEGKLSFMRVVQSRKTGLDEYDVSNITMTINYIRQTLRETPSKVVLISPLKKEHQAVEGLTIPLEIVEYPPHIVAPEEDKQSFILPISALLAAKKARKENLLTRAYRAFIVQKGILTYCIYFFIIASIIGSGTMMTRIYEIYAIKKIMAPIRAEMATKQTVYREFEEKSRELQKFMPAINYLNAEYTTPDVQKALIGLQSLYTNNIKINDVEIRNDRQVLLIQIKGIIMSRQYTELQSRFQQLLDSIKKIEGMEISSQNIDLINRNFFVQVRCKI